MVPRVLAKRIYTSERSKTKFMTFMILENVPASAGKSKWVSTLVVSHTKLSPIMENRRKNRRVWVGAGKTWLRNHFRGCPHAL